MAKKNNNVLKNKNLLPLLAITGIFLSLSLVVFTNSVTKANNTQEVLSKSTETAVLPTATPKTGINIKPVITRP